MEPVMIGGRVAYYMVIDGRGYPVAQGSQALCQGVYEKLTGKTASAQTVSSAVPVVTREPPQRPAPLPPSKSELPPAIASQGELF